MRWQIHLRRPERNRLECDDRSIYATLREIDWNAMTDPSTPNKRTTLTPAQRFNTPTREGTRIALNSRTLPGYHWAPDHCLMSVCVGKWEVGGKGRGIVQNILKFTELLILCALVWSHITFLLGKRPVGPPVCEKFYAFSTFFVQTITKK